MGRNHRFFLSFLLISLLLVSSQALTARPTEPKLNETWVHSGWLTSQDVARWSKAPGTRAYVIKVLRADTQELKALMGLSGATSLTIESESYPEAADAALWAGLAGKFPSFKLKLLDLQLPGDEQIAVLNRIGAASIELVLTYFPDMDESGRLSQIESPLSIEFRTPFYPRYEEKELLLAIPGHVALTFVATLWPWYHQMDVMNMTPHPKKLRINDGSFPSGAHWDYLANIRDLQETTVVSDYAPPTPDTWKQFVNGQVVWHFRSGVPHDTDLRAFEENAAAGSRKLVLETDSSLGREDRSRIDSIKVPVEWKHPAPLQ